MTAEDSAYGKVESLEGPVLAEGLKGILGTGRRKTTGRTALQRRQTDLIEADKEYERSYRNLLQDCLDLLPYGILPFHYNQDYSSEEDSED